MAHVTEANRKHFDEMADRYNTREDFKVLIGQMTAFLRANLAFIHPALARPPGVSTPGVRLLDYACGPGTVTQALAAHISEATGIDLSPNMVAAYNARFTAPPPHAHAVVGNLLADPPDAVLPADDAFDLVAVGMGFHHFNAHGAAVARLAERLKPGGSLLIVDFAPHGNDLLVKEAAQDPAVHSAAHTVTAHGFTPEEMTALFEGAGLKQAEYRVMEGDAVIEAGAARIVRKVFMARARKAGSG